jgi:hypothetical protein
MNRKIFTTAISLFSLLFVFSSCSKRDVISNEEDIVGTWAVTGIRSDLPYDWNGDGYTETDIYGSYNSCQRDIALSFESYGSGQSRQGCNASWRAMSWELTNNNRTLRINLPSDDLNLDLTRYTSNTIIGNDLVYLNGRNFEITYTLSRR